MICSRERIIRYPDEIVRSDGTRIFFATEERDKHQAYCVRYSVFAEEMGRTSLAIPNLRIYKDDMDDGRCHLIVAKSRSGDIIGTLRVTLRAEQILWAERAMN